MNFILPFIAKNRRPQLSLDDEEVGSEEDIAMLPDTKEIQNRLSLDSGGPSLNITNHLIDDPTIDLFFQTMAATLKTLPKQTQAQVKADIFQIISKAEIASFSNG